MIIVKNPQGRNLLLLLLAGGVGYGVYRHRRQAREALRKARDVAADLRPPNLQPVVVPQTREEHQMVDDAICLCFQDTRETLGDDADVETVISVLTLCTAEMLYPDMSWPPQVGDHESIAQFWNIVEYRIRSLIYAGELEGMCQEGAQPGWSDVPADPPQPGLPPAGFEPHDVPQAGFEPHDVPHAGFDPNE